MKRTAGLTTWRGQALANKSLGTGRFEIVLRGIKGVIRLPQSAIYSVPVAMSSAMPVGAGLMLLQQKKQGQSRLDWPCFFATGMSE